jgi:hypothetical protein
MPKRDLKDMRPMPEEDDISQWIDATMEERAHAFLGLLGLVDAIGRYPPKDDLPVVFPPRRRTDNAS